MPIPYPNGLRDANGNWIHKPVHFQGTRFQMRCDFAEAHHGYYFAIVMPPGFWLITFAFYPAVLFGLILIANGIWWTWDDWVDQHPKQVMQYSPLYHSLVHRLYGKIYKYKAVRWLNSIVSAFFHLFRKDSS